MADNLTKIAEAQGVLMEDVYLPAFVPAFIAKAAEYGIPVNSDADILTALEIAASIKQAEAAGIMPQANTNSLLTSAATTIKQAVNANATQPSSRITERTLAALDNLIAPEA